MIGNPPYVSITNETEARGGRVFQPHYGAAGKGNYDIYVVFVERGLSLLNPQGLLGSSCRSKFFATDYGGPLRGCWPERAVAEIVDFATGRFPEARTYTCLLFLSRRCDLS